MPTLPKIFRPVFSETLIFMFGLIKRHILALLATVGWSVIGGFPGHTLLFFAVTGFLCWGSI